MIVSGYFEFFPSISMTNYLAFIYTLTLNDHESHMILGKLNYCYLYYVGDLL